jgi:excisionase family DNA binding protein
MSDGDTFMPHASATPILDQLDLFDQQASRSKGKRRASTLHKPLSISVSQAMARYGVGRTKIYELLGDGSLKARKLGAKTLIDVEAADRFFLSLPAFGAD